MALSVCYAAFLPYSMIDSEAKENKSTSVVTWYAVLLLPYSCNLNFSSRCIV